MALESLPDCGAIVADKYRIEKLIGKGGMGAVYLAHHLVTDKRVALKWLLPRADSGPDEVERFIREARAAARIEHPNIVNIYDVGEHGGSFFLVMEYLSGRPFSDAVERAPLPAGPTLRSLMPAMRGIHAAHRRGVVHRDIKPDNIFLCYDEDGRPLDAKVLDFGISKLHERQTNAAPSLTMTGMVMGTPHYIAPEQALDAKSVDVRADVYAMGVILYQALGGHVPFDAESLTALLLKITRGESEHLSLARPDLPPALCDVIMKAMALSPDERYDDMSALMDALTPYVGATSLPMETVSLIAPLPDASATPFAVPSLVASAERQAMGSRVRWPWVAGGLVVVALLLLWLTQGTRPELAEQPLAPPVPVAAAPAPVHVVEPAKPAEVPVPTPEPEPEPVAIPVEAAKPAVAAIPAKSAPRPKKARKKRASTARIDDAEPAKPGTAGAEPVVAVPKPKPQSSAPAVIAKPAAPQPSPAPAPRTKGRLGIEMRPDQF